MKLASVVLCLVLLWTPVAQGSVLYVLRQEPHSEFQGSDAAFSEEAVAHLKTLFSVPGIKRLQAFQGIVGADRTLLMFRFSDLAAWSQWADNSLVQRSSLEQNRLYAQSLGELWVPSPYLPVPIYLAEDVGYFLNIVRGNLSPQYGLGGSRSETFEAEFTQQLNALADIPGADEIRMYVPAVHLAPHMLMVVFSFQDAAIAAEYMASEGYEGFEAFLRSHTTNLRSELMRPAPQLPDLVHVPESDRPAVEEDRWELAPPMVPVDDTEDSEADRDDAVDHTDNADEDESSENGTDVDPPQEDPVETENGEGSDEPVESDTDTPSSDATSEENGSAQEDPEDDEIVE